MLGLLRGRTDTMPEAGQALDRESQFLADLRAVFQLPLRGMRIRSLGHCHLGQFVRRGERFWIVDYQPDPNRRVGERHIKRSPLEDVAGVLRSVHYVAFGRAAGLLGEAKEGKDRDFLRQRAERWHGETSAALLGGYLSPPGIRGFLPERDDQIRILLDALLLQRASQDLAHDLLRRPRWAELSLTAILQMARRGPLS